MYGPDDDRPNQRFYPRLPRVVVVAAAVAAVLAVAAPCVAAGVAIDIDVSAAVAVAASGVATVINVVAGSVAAFTIPYVAARGGNTCPKIKYPR
jgi:Mg/Co/Ni transporter MgtE